LTQKSSWANTAAAKVKTAASCTNIAAPTTKIFDRNLAIVMPPLRCDFSLLPELVS
jgi:hypothetical protein